MLGQFILRHATLDDIPALEPLIAESVRKLQATDYTPQQIEGALGSIFGIDRQLIRDCTYFVIESDGHLVAAGGWSKRRTMFGSDDVPQKDDSLLDPATDPARIRAFFVHPAYARQGLGSRIMQACESAARSAGFKRLELVATLTGEPLYARHGFTATERFEIPLSNGAALAAVRMSKST